MELWRVRYVPAFILTKNKSCDNLSMEYFTSPSLMFKIIQRALFSGAFFKQVPTAWPV